MPLLNFTILLHAFLFFVYLLAMRIDQRQLLGVSVWLKPAKFALSIAIYLATLRWMLQQFPVFTSSLEWIALVSALTMLVEIVLLTLQASRGIMSHFNISSPGNAVIFQVMGVAIVINTLMLGWLGAIYYQSPPPLSQPLVWGIRYGIVLCVLGGLQGFSMGARLSHTVGAADGGEGLPIVNWSRRHGDLRIAHALGLHSLQALPLLGWLLPADASLLIVHGAAILWLLTFVFLLRRALRGKPLFA
jgi:hypothetical protein